MSRHPARPVNPSAVTPMARYNLVPKFYVMDPVTEDLLIDGTMLKSGMRVLIENPDLRAKIGTDDELDPLPDYELDKALERNRWCTISNIQFTWVCNEGTAIFIGTYDDGTKRKLSFGVCNSWLVKRDTIPQNAEIKEIINAARNANCS